MTTLYFVTAVVGGLLVVLSLLGGGSDSSEAELEASGDLDADADLGAGDSDLGGGHAEIGGGPAEVAGAHAEIGGHAEVGAHGDVSNDFHKDLGSETWIPFLSMRFWTFFFAFFGLCGLLLGWLTNVGELTRGLSAGASGFAAGLVVSYLMRYLRRSQVHGGTALPELVGSEAKVLLPISPENPGKIRIERRGEMIDIVASCDEGTLPIGADVLIISIDGSEAKVVSSAAVLGVPGTDPQLTP
ncbi:MAG: NfeD family protein [Myxococcales bacterium]|nr:NfeD family protein [Myxococcales bacterium]